MPSPETPTRDGFTVRQFVAAPRERVWHAWTDADALARWHHPSQVSTPRGSVELDVREGGTYRYTMVDDRSGDEYPTAGTYLRVEGPELLTFTWGTPGAPHAETPVVAVLLTEHDEGTEVTLSLRGADGEPGDDNLFDGWTQALANLATHLEH